MKRLSVLMLSALLLTGCSVKEPTALEQAVAACLEVHEQGNWSEEQAEKMCVGWDDYFVDEAEFIEFVEGLEK
jgi:hypothetical protein